MEIDPLGDFNEVVEYYKCMIDLAERVKPNVLIQYTMTSDKELTHKYWMAKIRAHINNIGISIAQNFEHIRYI